MGVPLAAWLKGLAMTTRQLAFSVLVAVIFTALAVLVVTPKAASTPARHSSLRITCEAVRDPSIDGWRCRAGTVEMVDP